MKNFVAYSFVEASNFKYYLALAMACSPLFTSQRFFRNNTAFADILACKKFENNAN